MPSIFDELFGKLGIVKTRTQKPEARRESAVPTAFMAMEEMKPGSAYIFTTPTTPEKRRAAADRLLRNMPPAVKKGEKPAHVLLAEYRAGK